MLQNIAFFNLLSTPDILYWIKFIQEVMYAIPKDWLDEITKTEYVEELCEKAFNMLTA